jgi:hypothetical protein
VYVDVNSILGLLHVEDVDSVASVVSIEVSKVVQFFVYVDPVLKKQLEERVYLGQKGQWTRKVGSCSFKGHKLHQKITGNRCS